MLAFTTGDVLSARTEALVNTVNCVGVMGRGVALQFKDAFPANFRAYHAACGRGEVQPGRLFVFETGTLSMPRYIVNFPTKRHWRGRSRMEDIEAGLAALEAEIEARAIGSVAIPPLGSGLGGLHWPDVRERIVARLARLSGVSILVFEPTAGPVATRSTEAVAMTPGRAALVGLMDRYLGGLMDLSVSLLEIHKLMYFMQEAGEPLKLRYVKGHYGPYAENLRHVLKAIEGQYVAGYADGGDAPGKRLDLVPGAVAEAEACLGAQPQTALRFDRVAALAEGFETPFGLELLATTHWVCGRDRSLGEDGIVERVHAWGERKKRFSPRQIGIAEERLREQGWLA